MTPRNPSSGAPKRRTRAKRTTAKTTDGGDAPAVDTSAAANDAPLSDLGAAWDTAEAGDAAHLDDSLQRTAVAEPTAAAAAAGEPTAVMASWWPANVRLPDGTTRTNVRVYATDQGLIVYDRPGRIAWQSAIDYGSAARPAGNPVSEGHQVETADGTVYVAITVVGCTSCGSASGLKTWEPSYAGVVRAWGDTTTSTA